MNFERAPHLDSDGTWIEALWDDRLVTGEWVEPREPSLARSGSEAAFERLVEPHRRELQVHCYRLLGSVQDAEEMLQETLVAAWRALESFEGRASLRTWLYRIATNACLGALRRDRPPRSTTGSD